MMPMRVFVGPVEIAGYYSQLAAALRGIGVDAVFVDLSDHRFRYESVTHSSVWVRAAIWAERRARAARGRPRAIRAFWRALRLLTRVGLVAWSIRRFDAFIFGFGESLLFGRELWLLRLLGKRLVFTFNGSDARPPYIDGADMAVSRGATIDDCIRAARRKKRLIRSIERHSHAVVALPTFSHFFERSVVDYLRVGAPSAETVEEFTPETDPDRELRVLHSPSDPEVKGSELIRATVTNLREGGLPVRLYELRDVPNSVVRAEIGRADFVVDQLYSDTPMAIFATEAANAGVPAIVGSYAWPVLGAMYSAEVLPPVEPCHPDDLARAIGRLASDEAHRVSLGARARAFVQSEWAPSRIAERYMAILRGDVSDEWLFDPRSLKYVHGVGLPEKRSREIVAGVLARGGRSALQLIDKPELEQAFVDFAEGR